MPPGFERADFSTSGDLAHRHRIDCADNAAFIHAMGSFCRSHARSIDISFTVSGAPARPALLLSISYSGGKRPFCGLQLKLSVKIRWCRMSGARHAPHEVASRTVSPV